MDFLKSLLDLGIQHILHFSEIWAPKSYKPLLKYLPGNFVSNRNLEQASLHITLF